MKNLTNTSKLISALLSLVALPLVACAADATPGEQGATQDPLGGSTIAPSATPCSVYSPSPQKCEAQPQCDYDRVKSACIDAPGSPGPAPTVDPCTQAFGSDEKQCATASPKCTFDRAKSVCIQTPPSPGPVASACGSYTDPTKCMADRACTYDRQRNACIDASSSTTVGTSPTTAVDAYCMKTYGGDQKACGADAKCVFDIQRAICRGR